MCVCVCVCVCDPFGLSCLFKVGISIHKATRQHFIHFCVCTQPSPCTACVCVCVCVRVSHRHNITRASGARAVSPLKSTKRFPGAGSTQWPRLRSSCLSSTPLYNYAVRLKTRYNGSICQGPVVCAARVLPWMPASALVVQSGRRGSRLFYPNIITVLKKTTKTKHLAEVNS